jgi:hypothetical protein
LVFAASYCKKAASLLLASCSATATDPKNCPSLTPLIAGFLVSVVAARNQSLIHQAELTIAGSIEL